MVFECESCGTTLTLESLIADECDEESLRVYCPKCCFQVIDDLEALDYRSPVNYEKLYNYINAMKQLYDSEDIKNLVNFFHLLSTDPSYANIAHDELKQFNI